MSNGEDVLRLGGMTLRRRKGGVDVEVKSALVVSVRLQEADLPEIAAFLTKHATHNGGLA